MSRSVVCYTPRALPMPFVFPRTVDLALTRAWFSPEASVTVQLIGGGRAIMLCILFELSVGLSELS